VGQNDVCTNDPTINRERVEVRVADGGHGVPEEKILQRYSRSLSLLPRAIAASNRAYLFDNSASSHRLVAEFENSRLVQTADHLPPWVLTSIGTRPKVG
jgi:predicted ABC-type ATPase